MSAVWELVQGGHYTIDPFFKVKRSTASDVRQKLNIGSIPLMIMCPTVAETMFKEINTGLGQS